MDIALRQTARLTLLLVFFPGILAGENGFAGDPVSYNRDIRPIFSDKCYLCHGPDESSRQAGFRLDRRNSATAEADSGERPIVPGEPESSELMRRILSGDDYESMPPADSHKSRLTPDEIGLIRDWIGEGALYQKHWALIPPQRPDPGALGDDSSYPNPIDQLVASRLAKQGLQFSEPADKRTLIRRVTLDLTGLPPTAGEVQAFVNDASDDAWEQVVNRLLESPRYGEHMARYWLDAVRYGDTHGLHLDNYREVWPYRDWVIRAFNRNMPWDEFTVAQLAGDLLPDPSTDDLVASGFNRLHITTNEGGTIPEEARVRNVIDRVETVGTVYLGMTVGCAVCHDHKFDPVSAREFYSLFAFFNNLDGNPMDGNAKTHAPVIQVPSPEQRQALAHLDEQIARLASELEQPNPEIDNSQAEWESVWSTRLQNIWDLPEIVAVDSDGGVQFETDDNGIIQASGPNPDQVVYEITATTDHQPVTAIRLQALVDLMSSQQSNGRADNGNAVLSEIELAVRPLNTDQPFEPVSLVSAFSDHSQDQFPVAAAIDGRIDDASGWATEGYAKKEPRTAVFIAGSPFGFSGGTEIRLRLHFDSKYSRHSFGKLRLSLTSDASIWPVTWSAWNLVGPFAANEGQAAWHEEFGPEQTADLGQSFADDTLAWKPASEVVDGQVFPLTDGIGAWYFSRDMYSPGGRPVSVAFGSDDGIRVWLNGALVHENNVARAVQPDQDPVTLELQPGRNRLLVKIVNFGGAAGFCFRNLPEPEPAPDLATMEIIATPDEQRNAEQREHLKNYFRANHSPRWARMQADLNDARQRRDQLDATLPTTLIMKELAEPRPAYLLKRGQYDQPDTESGPLPAAVPAVFPQLPETAPANRMGLAQWLIDPQHPLMARVTVNRFWQQLYGRGIVATAEDFGSQGSWPTHPELLDWLAVEFRDTGWDVKRLMKTMVMSRTYCQSSRFDPERWQRDPANTLLARGPRFRMDAEMLRDQALALAGLLVNRLGGPSVKPPQPAGIWKSVAYVGSNTDTFKADTGPDKVHRRSIYTFWKRTAPPPEMSTFDAPSRESCIVRRERTNTPLQALLMLNDPQYVEAARHLAGRAMMVVAGSPAERAGWMLELATCRPATGAETDELTALFEDRLSWYRANPEQARRLVAIGEMPANAELNAEELAAWTLVANVVLNLDEVITKE